MAIKYAKLNHICLWKQLDMAEIELQVVPCRLPIDVDHRFLGGCQLPGNIPKLFTHGVIRVVEDKDAAAGQVHHFLGVK